MTTRRNLLLATCGAIAGAALPRGAYAGGAQDILRDSDHALERLYRTNHVAAAIGSRSVAQLIFPNIIKAGVIWGGAYGEGELRQGNRVDSFYNSVTASWGLQIGGQSFGYCVFLMNERAVRYIHKSDGWEIGVGPTVVVVNAGVAKNLSTSTLKEDAYAFIFDQQGLMIGIQLEGTKISRITR
jgi:lipid-binding SYLF domain-containing protein